MDWADMRRVGKVWERAGALGCVVAASLGIAACSSLSNMLSTSGDKAQAAADSTSGSATDASASLKPEDYSCPDVTVRAGAATLLIANKQKTGEIGAMDLRYQGSLSRFARDCMPHAGTMVMKVGIEGRVISGPAGGPGEVDVPLRIAVVEEGPEPKTLVSKLVHIPVTMTDTGNVTFTHLDPDIAFPIPRPLENLEHYVVYVGFDPGAASPPKKPAAKPRRKG